MIPSRNRARPNVSSTEAAGGAVRIERIEPGLTPQRPGDERREDQERAVRDVDHVHHAEDQREPGGEQGIHAADQQAKDQGLKKLRHCLSYLPGTGLPCPGLSGALGLPPREDLLGRGGLLGQDDLRHALLPLSDEELTLRATSACRARSIVPTPFTAAWSTWAVA